MGHEYSFIHRPAKTMKDFDTFSRRFGKNVAAYFVHAIRMRRHDLVERPEAYISDYFTSTPRPQRILRKAKSIPLSLASPLSESLVFYLRPEPTHSGNSATPSPLIYPTMYTSPLRYMVTTSVPLHNQQPHSVLVSSFNTYFPHVWLSLDAIVSPVGQTTSQLHGNILDYCMFESTPTFVSLANLLFPEVAVSICSMTQLLSRLQHESISATNRNYYQKSPLEDARSTLAASSYDGVEPLISAPSCDGVELLLSASSCDDVEPLLSASSCDGVDPLMFASYCGGVKPLLFVPYCDSVESLPSALYCDSVGFNLCDIYFVTTLLHPVLCLKLKTIPLLESISYSSHFYIPTFSFG